MAKTDDYDFHLVVLGNPRTQKRHRTVRRGRLVATYDPSAKDKEDILAVTHSQAPARPLAGPLRVDVELYYARPKSHYRTGKYAGVLKATRRRGIRSGRTAITPIRSFSMRSAAFSGATTRSSATGA